MWSAKDKKQRPPTPRWDPSIIVSPTTSLLHQRRTNPKVGRPHLLFSQNLLKESNDGDSLCQQQHDYLQTSPSLTSSFATGHFADVQQSPTSTSQVQQTISTTVNPRHVSSATHPDHTVHDGSLFAMHSSFPQVSFAQPNSRTREPTPPSSLISPSSSSTLASSQWDSQNVSPWPHRSHSDPSDQSAVEGHVTDESDSHIDVGSSSSSSAAPRVVHPVVTGGKCPRRQYSGKNLTLIRPSRLSFVKTASSSDDQSSSSPQTPVSKIPTPLSRKRIGYPGSTSSSSSSTTPSSVTLSPLSDEPRTEMDLLVRQYNIDIERQLRDIMNVKLPRLFMNCDALVHSMTKTLRPISAALGHIHGFGRLPAREFQQPKSDDAHMGVVKEEEAIQCDEPNVHDGRDQERITPPTMAPVKQLSESPPFATTANDELDSKIPPQQSNASRDSSSGEGPEAGRKRKRDQGLTSERSGSTSDNVPLLPESTYDGERAAPGSEAFAKPGLGPVSQTQSPPRPLVDKKGPSSRPSLAGDISPQATTIKANRELTGCMNLFMDCCIQLQLYLQQPIQTATLVGRNDAFDSPPSSILTPMHHSSRSGSLGLSNPLGIQHPSVQMKLKEEVQKAIKGGNDILIAIEQYHSDRVDLLDRMEAHRLKATASKIHADGRALFDEGTYPTIDGRERDGARQNVWTQLQEYLEQLDQRHLNQLRYGTMKLQSGCATLHQMLQSVFG
ncbi:hypothetical protein EC957_012166 [Mortierella hygrophila]|uniref:Uncharacterized protein n=1 Tax=Mortierella hygrophila TaxID=979708 RepID=A0A9P6F6X5_9FUNG|nr:hypothetical protein EC957_012166 [Mortierella hygrophila]